MSDLRPLMDASGSLVGAARTMRVLLEPGERAERADLAPADMWLAKLASREARSTVSSAVRAEGREEGSVWISCWKKVGAARAARGMSMKAAEMRIVAIDWVEILMRCDGFLVLIVTSVW